MELCCKSRPPGYELFFAPLEIRFDPTTLERVHFAYICSKHGHAKQFRDDGTRYFDHPKSAAWIYIDELNGLDPETIIDLLLHDLREDSYLLSPYRIAHNFGIERAQDIRALTKLPSDKETVREYLERVIARGPRVILAKLCDRLHNLRTMQNRSKEKQREQIEETRTYHLPMLVNALCNPLYEGKWADLAETLRKKIEEAISLYQV